MAPEFYWVNFGARIPGGGLSEGSCELSTSEPITRGEQVSALQEDLIWRLGVGPVNIRTFTHLRSESDTEDGS